MSDEEDNDTDLADKEKFICENQVTTENQEKMMLYHRDTLNVRKMDYKAILTDVLKRFPGLHYLRMRYEKIILFLP